MNREVELFEVTDPNKWESDLGEFEPSPFITPQWLQAVSDSTRVPVYLDFKSGNQTVGKIAGLKIKTGSLRKNQLFFYSSPAILAADGGLGDTVFDELLNYAFTNRFNKLVVRKYDSPFALKSNNRRLRVIPDEEFFIDLTLSSEENAKIRPRSSAFSRNVRKAEKNGALCFETQSTELVDRLIVLLDEVKSVRSVKGYEDYSYYYIPFMDEEVLRKTLENGLAKLFYTQIGEQVVAIQYVLIYKKRACFVLIGCSAEGYKIGVPSFMYYSMIMELRALGCESLNLGGAAEDSSKSGLVRFKKSIGGVPCHCNEVSSAYLLFPYTLLNPLLDMGRKLPESVMKKKMREGLKRILS